MGRIVAIEHLTLDGVVQAPGRPDEDRRDGFRHGGWANRHQDADIQRVTGERMSRTWSLLAGRRTYQDFAAHWPTQPQNPISEALTRARKYVVSTTLTEPLPWPNSTVVSGGTAAVARLKEERDENLVVFGSGELVRSLLPHRLVDELVLLIHPLALGSGRRLFADSGRDVTSYRLAESTVTPSGVLVAVYAPA